MEMLHPTVPTVALRRRTGRSIAQQFDSRELVESLIQINPRRA
jgi:hypothetical protein